MLVLAAWALRPLRGGPGFWARAYFDAMPLPLVVAGDRETYVVSTNDRVIGREIFLRGEFDFSKLDIALRVLEREGQNRPIHLIDVGANIGSISIPAAMRGYVDRAIAIEPHPANLRLLRANVALNGLDDRIEVLGLAVGNEYDTLLHLEESDFNSGNHRIGSQGVLVRATRLDDLGLPTHHALLWMDIEGYEGHALQGAKQLLGSGVPVVAEFNPEFLSRAGGRKAFDDALRGRRIFDLAAPDTATTLNSLAERYAGSYTDILAL